MESVNIQDLQQRYDFSLDSIIKRINRLKKKNEGKLVLLQFPDGLKPYSRAIVDYLYEKCENTGFLIWFGSCYGACDIPQIGNLDKIDLVVQFGHDSLQPSY